MARYALTVIILRFIVDLLLLLGASRLCGYPSKPARCVLGAAVGAVYSVVCIVPGFSFLGGFGWRSIFIALICWCAFGANKSGLQRGAVFWLLQMALGGVAGGVPRENIWGLFCTSIGVSLLFMLVFRSGIGSARYVPVELRYADKKMKITALYDTGNMLTDPVSGLPVLVVGADAAQMLTGLTREQLRRPVESVGSIPGLRLIPYKTIGEKSGFLLGLRLKQVRIGSRWGSRVVAFAPESVGSEGTYQALAGGML